MTDERLTHQALGDDVRTIVRGRHLSQPDRATREAPPHHGIPRSHLPGGLPQALATRAVDKRLRVREEIRRLGWSNPHV